MPTPRRPSPRAAVVTARVTVGLLAAGLLATSCAGDVERDSTAETTTSEAATTAPETSTTAAQGQAPEISITWGAVGSSPTGSCTSLEQNCRWIDGSVRGFEPGAELELTCTDAEGPYFSFTVVTDDDGAAEWSGKEIRNCLYGVVGSQTWLETDGVRSNRLTA